MEDIITRPFPLAISIDDDPLAGFSLERRMMPVMTFGKKATDATVKVYRFKHVIAVESGREHVYQTIVLERRTTKFTELEVGADANSRGRLIHEDTFMFFGLWVMLYSLRSTLSVMGQRGPGALSSWA